MGAMWTSINETHRFLVCINFNIYVYYKSQSQLWRVEAHFLVFPSDLTLTHVGKHPFHDAAGAVKKKVSPNRTYEGIVKEV